MANFIVPPLLGDCAEGVVVAGADVVGAGCEVVGAGGAVVGAGAVDVAGFEVLGGAV